MITRARGLGDLAAVKRALKERAAQAARAEAEAAAQQHERDLFARSVGQVTPVRSPRRVVSAAPKPAPIPRQRLQDEAQALRETLSDEVDVESLLETDDGLSFRRAGVGPEVLRKLRRGVWVVQAELDLHGLRRDEAREALGRFLREASRHGLRCLRIVHGKGHGSPGREPVLKVRVKRWLAQKEEVIAFTQARPAEGGAGALVVLLRPLR